MKTLTLKEWFNLNPTLHKKTAHLESGDQVRVVLHGGEGIDQILSGLHSDEARATEIALENREKMRQVLP